MRMIKLPALLDSWETIDFDGGLLKALSKLDPCQLPLKQLAQYSGLFDQDSLQFSILAKDENDEAILVKLSLFYQEISNPCPCSGEELENMAGHCELMLYLDKRDGSANLKIL